MAKRFSYRDIPADVIIICPRCQTKNLRADRFCRGCETSLDSAKLEILRTLGISHEGCNTGIKIECRLGWIGKLTMVEPHCIVNEEKRIELEWDRRILVPLTPNTPNKIRIEFTYQGVPCKPAFLTVTLAEGEIQEYLYTTSNNPTVFGKGTIERTG